MDNRKMILQCALELFYKRGYDATSVQEIVEMAGITKPTMYYYFKSKRGLLEALIQEKSEPLLQEVCEVPKRLASFEGQLYELAKLYMSFCKKERHFYFFMLGQMYSPPENEAHKVAAPFIRKQYEMITDKVCAPLKPHLLAVCHSFTVLLPIHHFISPRRCLSHGWS